MSCFSLGLPPAKKAWKSFTSKLQTKLYKLHKSKTIKKPKFNSSRLQTAVSKTTRPSLLSGQHLQRKIKKRRALPFGYRRYFVSKNKGAAPVFVDNLFKETPTTFTELVVHVPRDQQTMSEKNIGKFIDDHRVAAAGTSREGEKAGHESMRLTASPMLRGIDARAEEFIASFRAEMERQEIMARNL